MPLNEPNGRKLLNGKLTFVQIMTAIFTAATLGVGTFMLVTIIDMRSFMDRGDRFTLQQGAELENRVTRLELNFDHAKATILDAVGELRTETRRLQLQIDRLEGHEADEYTADHIR